MRIRANYRTPQDKCQLHYRTDPTIIFTMQPENPVPWRGRDIVFALVVMLAGILLLNVGVFAASALWGGALKDNRDLTTLILLAQELIILGAAWLFSVARYRAAWAQLGLRAFNAPIGCGLGLGLLIASYVIRFCYIVAAFALGWSIGAQSVGNLLSTSGWGLGLTFIAAGVAAPIAEEIFFRGLMYGGLRARLGVGLATLLSALVFTALHFTLELFIPIFVLGIFLAWLYEKTGSLYPGMILHSANNSIAVIALVILEAMGYAIA